MLLTIGICSLWSCGLERSAGENLGIAHVVVIGFDGLSPNGIENADTPNFDRLMQEGSYTLHARAVLPTSSSPNWASMIMGAGPEQHGITSNAWVKDNLVLPTVAQSEDFLFPTIFHLVDRQLAEAEIGAIYHWGGFGRLFEKNAVDFDINPESEEETAEIASNYIIEKKPDFTFIHFDHIDHAGHEFGHGSDAYYKAVESGDSLLGKVMESIKKAGITDETLVIISADHGGLGKGHGGESLKEIEIPFIMWGKSVKKNHLLKYPVYQYDNAATVAFALGLEIPQAWIGKAVKEGFENYGPTDEYPLVERLKEPVILPQGEGYEQDGGLFDMHTFLNIQNPNQAGEVRYTLDGSMPTTAANLAVGPIEIHQNTVVKSAIFNNGVVCSPIVEGFFRIKDSLKAKPIDYEVFYLKDLGGVPTLDSKKYALKGSCYEITSKEISGLIKNNTAVRFSTFITIERSDTYQFFTRSDDGSKLYINGAVVVDNDGDHGVIEKSGKIKLEQGEYPLEVVWFNGGGDGWIEVYYASGTIPKQILPTSILK